MSNEVRASKIYFCFCFRLYLVDMVRVRLLLLPAVYTC